MAGLNFSQLYLHNKIELIRARISYHSAFEMPWDRPVWLGRTRWRYVEGTRLTRLVTIGNCM